MEAVNVLSSSLSPRAEEEAAVELKWLKEGLALEGKLYGTSQPGKQAWTA